MAKRDRISRLWQFKNHFTLAGRVLLSMNRSKSTRLMRIDPKILMVGSAPALIRLYQTHDDSLVWSANCFTV